MARASFAFALALLACMSADEVEKPYWCPWGTWRGVCRNQATCETLAFAGLTCEGISLIDGCDVACAAPCCVTTSTSTKTSTWTDTSVTGTVTQTHTETSTVTATATSTQTHTHTTSQTSVTRTVTMTTGPPTTGPPTTSSLGPAALIRVAMRVKVPDMDEYTAYFKDQRVKDAYLAVMTNITGIPEDQVGVDMAATQKGNITVTCTLTVPYRDNGTALVPTMNLGPLQTKLMTMELESFNTMVKDAVDAATGEGTYSQQVLSVTETTGGVDVSAAQLLRPLAGSAVAFAAIWLLRR